MRPELGPIRRHTGVAGQVSYSALVTYGDELPQRVTFVGSTYGGPVVMITRLSGEEVQTFVTDPARFGTFGPNWVRRFFGQEA